MTAESASQTPEALLRAFAQTHYHVRLDAGETVVRVGEPHAGLDRALGAACWSILTAHNPQGVRADDRTNRLGHERLIDRARTLGGAMWPAINRDPRGAWPDERGLLITNLDAGARAALARELEQAALVLGQRREIARLELHGGSWPADLPPWAVRAG